MRTRLLWTAAAIVALAELAVASLVLMPRAAPGYRAYFIDKTSDCWPHDTPAAYTLGTTLAFDGHGPDFAPNKICGWFYPNEHGTWSYGRYSLLRFKFAPPAGALTLTIAAGAMVDAAHPLQHVAISANGTMLAKPSFDSVDPETRTVEIPAEIAKSGSIDLRFDYPDARSGRELGPNEDSHLRALRMISLRIAAP